MDWRDTLLAQPQHFVLQGYALYRREWWLGDVDWGMDGDVDREGMFYYFSPTLVTSKGVVW